MSEMNMREKVARAIHGEGSGCPFEEIRHARLDQADAVLDVLAEPDEGMIEAGHRKPIFSPLHDDEGELYVRHGDVAEIWQVMLETAARTPGAIEETGRRG